MSSAFGVRPDPIDLSATPYLSGVFAPVTDEVDVGDLPVQGELPAELDGVYLRNGPNPRFTPLGSYIYPFEGDGMVHGIWLRDGRARYANQFVRTPSLQAEERAGRALWGGLMTLYLPDIDEVEPELAGRLKDMPDINVVRHGGRLLALAESACPFALTPELATIGKETFGGALPAGITAHPKIDPVTGEMAVFCYGLQEPFLTWSILGPDGVVRRPPTPVDGVARPTMIHDMALTERYLVLVLSPFYFDLAGLFDGGSLLHWVPEDGSRIALIPRDGGPVRWAATDTFWSWHSAGAYDAGPGPDAPVVLDYVQWSTPGEAAGLTEPVTGGLARAEIDPLRGVVRRSWLDPTGMEFPRVDDRRVARRHDRIALTTSTGTQPLLPGDHDALCWYDATRARTVRWEAAHLAVGEPVFLPRPGDADPDHGWWAAFATDRADGASWFLVFPAADPGSGPLARVALPVRVPLGLHGSWLPTEE